MPYVLPTYNAVFRAKANFNFNAGANPVAPFILPNTACQLQYGMHVGNTWPGNGGMAFLLFASGVALKGRDSYAVKNGDAVEVPSGSGRWYTTLVVEYSGYGFANQHQVAVIAHPFPFFATAPVWP